MSGIAWQGRVALPRSFSANWPGGYIRQWVPELAGMSDPAIHDPEAAGCCPKSYPSKLIGHREARERALIAGKKVG